MRNRYGWIVGQELTELLRGPLSGRVLGDVEMYDASRTDFHGNEDVDDPKRRRDGNEEVTGNHGALA